MGVMGKATSLENELCSIVDGYKWKAEVVKARKKGFTVMRVLAVFCKNLSVW